MTIDFDYPMNKDELVVYMHDDQGYAIYVDGEMVWVQEQLPVCRIPGPVMIRITDELNNNRPGWNRPA